jgi:type II secretory pathway component PulJ
VSRLRTDEAGFTLTELLVAATLFIIVLGAALTSFNVMETKGRTNALLQDSQQRARQTAIVLSRQLRNLAGPDENQPGSFDPATGTFNPAGPYDIVFKTVNPNGPNAGLNPTNVERVRYCLDTGNPAKLWQQTHLTIAPDRLDGGNLAPDRFDGGNLAGSSHFLHGFGASSPTQRRQPI